MKILHVIPSLSPRRGGPSTALLAMCAATSRLGIDVEVAVTDDDGPDRAQPEIAPGDVTFHVFPRQFRFYSVSLPMAGWLWRNVARFDVVHVHSVFTFPSLVASLVAKWRRTPYVVRPLGALSPWGFRTRRPTLKRLYYAVLQRPMLRSAAVVHCASEREREHCSAFTTAVIPNPVAVPPDNSVEKKSAILFLSRFDPTKGIELLLDAFARALQNFPDAQLILAGDAGDDYSRGIRRRVESLGLGAKVSIHGFAGEIEKRQLMAAASIFVLPSHSESFGIAAAEAMAYGLPVVVSDQVGIAPDVERAGAGVIVSLDANSLADGLTRLLGDTMLSSEMGRNGKRLIQERYSPEAVALQLQAMYADVLHGVVDVAEVHRA